MFISLLILITKETTIWIYHHTIKNKGNQKLYLMDISFLICNQFDIEIPHQNLVDISSIMKDKPTPK